MDIRASAQRPSTSTLRFPLTRASCTVHRPNYESRNSKERQQSTQDAALAESFRILAKRVARNDEGNDAETAVVEATAKSALPISHCCCCCWLVELKSKRRYQRQTWTAMDEPMAVKSNPLIGKGENRVSKRLLGGTNKCPH